MADQLRVGDRVRYVPHTLHAREHDIDQNYPWVFGFKHRRQVIVDQASQRWGWEDYVEVLDDKRMKEIAAYLSRHSNRAEEEKNLYLLRPSRTWPAKVVAVNDDGTADIDIEARWCDRLSRGSGVTLHYRGVPVADTKKVSALMSSKHNADGSHPAASLAHTCHKETT